MCVFVYLRSTNLASPGRFCGLHRADPPSPSLQRAATAFQRLAEAAAREPRESREVPSRSASPRRVPSWGI